MIAALAFFTALTLVLAARVLPHPATYVLGQGADTALNVWTLAWDSHALLTQPLHLFEANIFFPLPGTLAYSEHLLGLWPLALPVHLVGGDPVLAYNLAVAATYVLAGLGMFLLVRLHTGDPLAAVLGGLAYAFGPFRLVHLSRLSLLGGCWLPFAVFFLERYRHRQGRSDWLLFWASVLLLFLSSWYWVVFGALVLGIYGLATRVPRPPTSYLTVPAAVAGLLLLVSLPYLGQADVLAVSRDYDHALRFSARPLDFLTTLEGHPLYGSLSAPLRARAGMHFEHFAYPGALLVVLALIGLLGRPTGEGEVRPGAGLSSVPGPRSTQRAPDDRKVRLVLGLVVLAGLVLSFGPLFPPYGWALRALPPLGFMRFPVRWLFVVSFGLSALAGLGAARLLAPLSPARRAAAAALTGAVLLLDSGLTPQAGYALGPQQALPAVQHYLAVQPGSFAVLALPMYVSPQDEEPEARRQYASTLHWKELVNGFSGATPARQARLQTDIHCLQGIEAQRALQELRSQGLRYLYLDLDASPLLTERWLRWQRPRWLVLEKQWPDGLLARVEAGEPQGTPLRLPAPLARFGQAIQLAAWDYDAASGELSLTWMATGRPEHDYTVFAHLIGPGGERLGQSDNWPGQGRYPTSQWCPGDVWPDAHRLPTPVPSGSKLLVGLYRLETMERLSVVSASLPIEESALVLPLP